MEKKLTNYKTSFVYSIEETGNAVNISVDFNIEGNVPVFTMTSPEKLGEKDIYNILDAMRKNLLYRMDFDIISGCKAVLSNAGTVTEYDSLQQIFG